MIVAPLRCPLLALPNLGRFFLFRFLYLLAVVMRLNAEVHGDDQHDQLKRTEDYRDPLHLFLKTLLQQLQLPPGGKLAGHHSPYKCSIPTP